MAGINGDEPVGTDDGTPPARANIVPLTPQEVTSEPILGTGGPQRLSYNWMSIRPLDPAVIVKLSLWFFLLCGLTAGILGFILGAVLGAVEIARISAIVGAALLGGLCGIMAFRVGINASAANQPLHRRFGGALFVALICGAIGALAGAVVVAFVGILCGAIAGSFLGAMIKRGPAGIGSGFLIGSLVGPLILAVYLDRPKAVEWGMHGAWMGAALGLILALIVFLNVRAGLRNAKAQRD